jgi:hypothetical protein
MSISIDMIGINNITLTTNRILKIVILEMKITVCTA